MAYKIYFSFDFKENKLVEDGTKRSDERVPHWFSARLLALVGIC